MDIKSLLHRLQTIEPGYPAFVRLDYDTAQAILAWKDAADTVEFDRPDDVGIVSNGPGLL